MPPQGQTKTVASGVSVPLIGDGILPPIPDSSPPRQPAVNEPSNADMATMSLHQLKHYLTTLIAREWKKSAACLYPARNNVIAELMLFDKELAVCHVKFRCEDVPADVVAKVRYLFDLNEQAKIGGAQDRAGHGCFGFDNFMALLRNELRMVTFEDDVNSPKIAKYKGVLGAVAMLAELAIFRVQMDIDYALDVDISHKTSFKVAIVCGRGHTYTYAFSAQLDAKFAVVMRELDRRFPRLCNPRCQNMVGRWLAHVEDLKQTGMDGHPRLAVVERLIQEHMEAPHEIFEEWMYVHEFSSRGDRLRGEEEFKALMQWAAASAGHQPKGCLMRVMEAKMREIFAALRMVDEDQDRIKRGEDPARFIPMASYTTLNSHSTRSSAELPDVKGNEKDKIIGTLRNGQSGNMLWGMNDIDKEGTGSPTKKRRPVSWGQLDGINTKKASKRPFPLKQGAFCS